MSERKITFQSFEIASGTVLRNLETGVEIYEAGGWYVEYPTNLSVVLPTWTEEPVRNVTQAKKIAVERVRQIRREVEEAHEKGLLILNADRTVDVA